MTDFEKAVIAELKAMNNILHFMVEELINIADKGGK
jgi:hypothetical protein